MAHIDNIKFNEWSIQKMDEGKKIATSRFEKIGNVGDTFNFNNRTYAIVDVWIATFAFVKMKLYLLEGAESPAEIEEILRGIYPHIQDRHNLYVHFFAPVNII